MHVGGLIPAFKELKLKLRRQNSLESPEPLIVQFGSDFVNSEEIYPKEEVKLYWHLKDDKVGWV